MKIALFLVFLSACASTPEFTPLTREGAACKVQCADMQYRYNGGYARCINSCRDVDRVATH